MKAVKRIEITCHPQDLAAITGLLDELGVNTYSILRDVIGRDDRGHRLTDDELTGVMKHSCLVTSCNPGRLDAVLDAIRPVLARHGGTCLVSDAQWLVH